MMRSFVVHFPVASVPTSGSSSSPRVHDNKPRSASNLPHKWQPVHTPKVLIFCVVIVVTSVSGNQVRSKSDSESGWARGGRFLSSTDHFTKAASTSHDGGDDDEFISKSDLSTDSTFGFVSSVVSRNPNHFTVSSGVKRYGEQRTDGGGDSESDFRMTYKNSSSESGHKGSVSSSRRNRRSRHAENRQSAQSEPVVNKMAANHTSGDMSGGVDEKALASDRDTSRSKSRVGNFPSPSPYNNHDNNNKNNMQPGRNKSRGRDTKLDRYRGTKMSESWSSPVFLTTSPLPEVSVAFLEGTTPDDGSSSTGGHAPPGNLMFHDTSQQLLVSPMSSLEYDTSHFTHFNVGVLLVSGTGSSFDLEKCSPAVDMALELVNQIYLRPHKIFLHKIQKRLATFHFDWLRYKYELSDVFTS